MIFGEPTDNELLVGSKGLLEYKLHFNGIKAHSSNPKKGKSANINAIKFLCELDDFYCKTIKLDKDNNFEIPYTTMNVGTINGGIDLNSISPICEVGIDFRIINVQHIELIKRKINEIALKFDCDVSLITELYPFINKIEFVKEIKTSNFLTEASFIKNNVSKIILGPGPITAHEINEYITEESYNKLVEQYTNLIIDICK